MPGQKKQQPLPPPQPPPPPPPPPYAVEGNEWGLDEAEIEEVYTKLQAPPRPPAREATALQPGQVELTEDDRQYLAHLQQRDAEGRTKKVTRSSELHPAVVGHNKSEQKQTQKLLRQWYYEQRYQLDKVSNAQRATYRQLRLLHVDRRRQVRELMNYRREEARAEVERERQRQQRAKELALLERQLERLRQEEAMERRPSSADLRLQPLKPARPAVTKKVRGPDAAVAAVAAATAEAVAAAAGTSAEPPPPVDTSCSERPQSPLPSNQQDATTQGEMVTVTAKVVEVERRGIRAARQGAEEMTVLERSRSKSFIRESTGSGMKAAQQQPATTSQPPQPPAEPPGPPVVRAAAPAHPPQKKATAAEEKAEVVEPPQPTVVVRRLPLTQVERNRLRARRQEEASKRLLLEPYGNYRMGKGGEIEPVEFQPPRFPTTEPSNRPLYEQHKRLQREKASYVASMNRLGRFTAEVLNESIRLAEAFEQPKEVQGKSGPPKELRLGPSDWMKVFIRTNAPEEVEAGTFEAMKYIEYLRPEAPNTDRDMEPDKVFEDV